MSECSVCYENLPTILKCHCVCEGCVTNHFKQECPVCRASHSLPITGKRPESNIVDIPKEKEDESEESDKPRKTLMEIYTALRKTQKKQEVIDEEQSGEAEHSDCSSVDVEDEDSAFVEDYDY